MATFTLKSSVFPPGTTVGAYAGVPPVPDQRAGGPATAAVSSGTMAAVAGASPFSSVLFTGLNDGGLYYAAAQVSSVWQYVPFTADAGQEPTTSNNLLRPSAALSETMNRLIATSPTLALTSGTLRLAYGLRVKAGQAITSITLHSGTTAGATLTNQWFALYSASLAKLAVTVDDTSTAWAANAAKTLLLPAPYTPPDDATLYVGCMVAATTPPSLCGAVAVPTQPLGLAPPIIGGNSTGSLTNPASAPAIAAAISTAASPFYAYVS